jgi:hypothetical protein
MINHIFPTKLVIVKRKQSQSQSIEGWVAGVSNIR